eukprot:Nk52_evm6s2635 gene=Nk52_evmTU6s2635
MKNDSDFAVESYRKKALEGDAESQYRLGDLYYVGGPVLKDYDQAVFWLKKSASQDYPAALTLLGSCFYFGNGVESSVETAAKYFEKASYLGDSQAQFCYADIILAGRASSDQLSVKDNSVKERKALKLLKSSALHGNGLAQLKLAELYFGGELANCGKDLTESYAWYKRAATNGLTQAFSKLGDFYYYGYGMEVDYSNAFHCYQKAADAGDLDGLCSLGWCYENGLGCEETSCVKAMECYEQAAKRGHTNSMYNLAVMKDENLQNEQGKGSHLEVEKQIFGLYLKSSEGGLLKAYNNLAACYLKGRGVSKSPEKAFQWWEKAAISCHIPSVYNLGQCYLNGWGCEKDEGMAFSEFFKAADMGHVGAQYKVGVCYEKGIHVTKSREEAAKWYQIAMDQNHLGAEEAFKRLTKPNIFSSKFFGKLFGD